MTLTARDLEEFDISVFINKCLQLDAPELLLRCLNFGILVQSIRDFPDEPCEKAVVLNFTRFIFHLQRILAKSEDAEKPIGMSSETFLKVKPIVEKLVASGYLKNDWLQYYKDFLKKNSLLYQR